MANKIDVTSSREYEYIINKTFSSQEEAYEFYNDYAKKKGFSIRKSIVRKDPTSDTIIFRRFYCSRSGFRETKYLNKPNRKRAAPALSRCGCPVELCVKLDVKTNRWWVENYVDVHNHSVEAIDTTPFLRSHCKIYEPQKFEIVTFQDSSVHNCQILEYTEMRSCGYEYRGFQSKNLYNFSADHEKSVRLVDDADSIIKYFKERKKADPDFYFKHDTKDGHLTCLFWADAQSVIDYANFGDVVVFDSTYKLNRYNMVVVPFLGCNHHRSTIIFACGIVSEEDKDSYQWLLKALMEAMYQVQPESVITDGDLAMRVAIKSVLPGTTHRTCAWHMSENAKKYLHGSRLKQMFYKLTKEECSPEDFEKNWHDFEKKASKRLATRKWLQKIYDSKHLWAGAFVRKKMFLGMATNQRSESINSKLHRYMNSKMSLCKVVKQLERCLTRMRTKEAELDCKAFQTEPVLTTPFYNLEKSAAINYTPRIFVVVRSEIEKSIEFVVIRQPESMMSSKYEVALKGKIEALATVECFFFEGTIEKLLCTCFKFECEKIPCSHMFAVLIHLDVTIIPHCCISNRWTKNAKSVFPSDRKGGLFKVSKQQRRYHELIVLANRVCYEASKSSVEFVTTNELLKGELRRLKDSGEGIENSKDEIDEIVGAPESPEHKIKNPKPAMTKGAPRKKKYERMKSTVENRRKNKCGHCGKLGHNRVTCQLISQESEGSDSGSSSSGKHGDSRRLI